VVRHYALALTLIIPLVLLLTGAATGSLGDMSVAVERIVDTNCWPSTARRARISP